MKVLPAHAVLEEQVYFTGAGIVRFLNSDSFTYQEPFLVHGDHEDPVTQEYIFVFFFELFYLILEIAFLLKVKS